MIFERWRARHVGPRMPIRSWTSVPGSGLHVCPACRAPFVHPVARGRLDASRWWMLLRCGNCRHERDAVISDDVAARYDGDLRTATEAIARTIEEEDRERLERQADAFAAALDRDLIDADDFFTRTG